LEFLFKKNIKLFTSPFFWYEYFIFNDTMILIFNNL